MTNQSNIITKTQILAKISQRVAQLVSEGFVIENGYSSYGFAEFRLSRGNEKISIDVSPRSIDHNRCVTFTENGEIIGRFFEITYDVYTTSEEEIKAMHEVTTNRSIARRKNTLETLSVERYIKVIRKIKGFRSVPMKNMTLSRRTREGERPVYTLKNTESGNMVQF